jgi:hypothetical protein
MICLNNGLLTVKRRKFQDCELLHRRAELTKPPLNIVMLPEQTYGLCPDCILF